MALLRESGRTREDGEGGGSGRFDGVVSGDAVRAPAMVEGGAALTALVDAAFARDPEALVRARAGVIEALGAPALIDAAAVFGNFQRMVRIADGTGIPLDEMVLALTADLREPLGVGRFHSAGNTPPTPLWRRLVHPTVRRKVRELIRRQTSSLP